MPADPQRLQATLDELHQQLAEIGPLDAASRNQLSTALREIQATLRSKKLPEKTVLPRLREAAHNFEGSHPTLSATIGSLVDVLAQMGI
jgi:hypothetical protein